MQGVEVEQLADIANMNSQIRVHLECQFTSIYLRLNYTRVIYSSAPPLTPIMVLDPTCNVGVSGTATDSTSSCLISLTQSNLATWRLAGGTSTNNPLFFYKYGVSTYSSLTASDKSQISLLIQYLDLHRSVLSGIQDKATKDDTKSQLYFFYFPTNGLIIVDSVRMSAGIDDFASQLNDIPICRRYNTCLNDLTASECMEFQTQCLTYQNCLLSAGISLSASTQTYLQCLNEQSTSTNEFTSKITAIQEYNNYFHGCLQITSLMNYCGRIDLFVQFKDIANFNSDRFILMFAESNYSILYNNYQNYQFFGSSTVIAKLLELGKSKAKKNYSKDKINKGFETIVQTSQAISESTVSQTGIIHIDSRETYDSMKLMMSMQILRIPASYIESIESKYSSWNFGVFLVSSNEKFQEQMDFYNVFQKLFFVYSGLELVFLVLFFYLLAAVLKSLLIGLAQSIIFFARFVKKIDLHSEKNSDEIHQFKEYSEQNHLAAEILVLAENLDHFVWVVDFFSKAKEAKMENQMLKKGIVIFKKINSYEGLEIVYDKLISQCKRNAADGRSLEEASNHCLEILHIQLEHRQDLLDKKDRQSSLQDDDLLKINNKICQYINNILNIIAKLLALKVESMKMEEYMEIYESVIKTAKELNFKEFQKVRLLLKKARILYKRAAYGNNPLFKRSAKKLDHAWKILEEIKQNDKDDNFQVKNITVLKQKVLFHKGVASQHYGNDQEALKFLTSSLEYGSYYSNRLRVKTLNFMATILKNPNYRKKKEILQDLSAFIRKDKRNFYFLVDCSKQLVDIKNKVATIISKIFNEYMSDKDKITIIRYGDRVEPITDLYEKEVLKKRSELATVDAIERQLQPFPGNGRCLYKAFQECIEQAKNKEEKTISKYIIIFAFGENYLKRDDGYMNNKHGHNNNNLTQNILGQIKDNNNNMLASINNMNNNNNSGSVKSGSNNQGDDDENSSQVGYNDENSQVSMSVVSGKGGANGASIRVAEQLMSRADNGLSRVEGDEEFDVIQKELTDGFFHLLLIKQNVKNHGSTKSKILQLCEKSRRHYVIDLDSKPYIPDIIKDVAGFLQ